MANSSTIDLRLKLTDDGTIVIDKFTKKVDDLDKKSKKVPRKFSRNLGSINKKMAIGVKRSLSFAKGLAKIGTAGVVAGIIAVSGAFLGLKSAVTTASDLQEVTSKFNTVFKDQKHLAEDWAKTLVDSYAMSTREAKQYLSSVQDLLVPMGMESAAAGKLSNEIVKLAADLGSFNNLPTAQVIDDMQSALVGNYETMKKYGVVLNATVVQEKALAMGLAATKKELTAAHKAQAAYALMVQGSQAAIGDMERTSDGYANQMKKLKANTDGLIATLGGAFLPLATKIVTGINQWYAANQDLIKVKIDEWAERIIDGASRLWEWIIYVKEGVIDWYYENQELVDSNLEAWLDVIVIMFKTLGKMMNWVIKLADAMFQVFARVFPKIRDWIDKIYDKIGRLIDYLAEATETLTRFLFASPSGQAEMEPVGVSGNLVTSQATGTGLAGLPWDGLFRGHRGEIVLNREQSKKYRQEKMITKQVVHQGDRHINLHFNQQVSRSDVSNIVAEQERQAARG